MFGLPDVVAKTTLLPKACQLVALKLVVLADVLGADKICNFYWPSSLPQV